MFGKIQRVFNFKRIFQINRFHLFVPCENFERLFEGEGNNSKRIGAIQGKSEKRFVPPTVRAMICGINNYLEFLGSPHRIEQITVPKQKKSAQKDFITKDEYLSILKSIKRTGNDRLFLIVESIVVAGLKLSELKFLTVEAVIKRKVALPDNDVVYLSKHLCEDLLEYCRDNNIFSGTILLTRGGKIPDKANVSREIKKACLNTGIDVKKISTKTLREFYFRNFESYRCEIVEMIDKEWNQ